MQKNNSLFKKIALLCIALLLVIIAWGGLVSAPASSQDRSRINSLEVDINGIESRLNRIEAQLNQLRRYGSAGAPLSEPPRDKPPLNSEQMFDRLATLVIELREQIRELEARVSKLESLGAPSR